MTSTEIFRLVDPRAMRQKEDEQKLQNAMTGVSMQQVVTNAIASKMGGMAQSQPQQTVMPQSNPQGWGSTQG